MVKRVLKIYIAGPMTGYPDYNRAAFNAKASELMAEGHIVLNPAVLLVAFVRVNTWIFARQWCVLLMRSTCSIDGRNRLVLVQSTRWLKSWG